jgi:hypothetical protein
MKTSPVPQRQRFEAKAQATARELEQDFGLKIQVEVSCLDAPNAMTAFNLIVVDPRIPLELLPSVLFHEAGHLWSKAWTGNERASEYEADVFTGVADALTGRESQPLLDWLAQVEVGASHGTLEERAAAMAEGEAAGRLVGKVNEALEVLGRSDSTKATLAEQLPALRLALEQLRELAAEERTMLRQLGPSTRRSDLGALARVFERRLQGLESTLP